MKKSSTGIFLLFTIIWIVMAGIVNPLGDFPLNDDWSYGKTVYNLVEKGHLRVTPWVSFTLIAQVIWGSLFCLPFGFSFTALRFSTLSLGLIGIFATYSILKEAKTGRAIAMLGSLIIAVNPIFFALSNTFMSDVPFFSCSALSLLFLNRYLRLNKGKDIILGTLFACIASLIRQFGVVMPLAFGAAFLIKNGIKKNTCKIAISPAAFTGAVTAICLMWLKTTGSTLPQLDKSVVILGILKQPILNIVEMLARDLTIALLYLGLFLFPLLMLQFTCKHEEDANKHEADVFMLLASVLFSLLYVLFLKGDLMPFSNNVLTILGVGPLTLRDVNILKLPHLRIIPEMARLFGTFISAFGAILLLQNLFLAIKDIVVTTRNESVVDRRLIAFPFLIFIFYIIPVLLIGYYDRYFIFLLPALMLIITGTRYYSYSFRPRRHAFLVIPVMIIYAVLSVGATHDYLSWNRARWKALNFLTKNSGISYKKIDGGFEFNGWYGYDPEYQREKNKSWWWVHDDDYIVSFGPIMGYEAIGAVPYKRTLPFSDNYIFVLKRRPA